METHSGTQSPPRLGLPWTPIGFTIALHPHLHLHLHLLRLLLLLNLIIGTVQTARAQSGVVTSDSTFTQQAYLKASNTAGEDRFGIAVSVSGDTVVIGADGEDDDATGVNGDGSHNSNTSPFAGAAYVFVRSGAAWTQQAYLKASNTGALDAFGFAVAMSGDTIVIGAYGEDSNATGVDGDQSDNSAPNSGAAYVFVRDGTTWRQQAYLKASNTGAGGDRFGFKVAVSGDTVVIGAPDEDSNAAGLDGNQNDNSTQNAGAAYIFVRNGTIWTQQAYLKASNPGLFDNFGSSVAVSDHTVVVGAKNEPSNATGVNHPTGQNNNSALSAGAAYIFVRSGTAWSQQAYVKASNTGPADEFGDSVGVSGETVVIGARGEDSSSNGINGIQSDNTAPDSGAAYVFVRAGTTWAQQAYVKASNTGPFDYFGKSVTVSGDTMAVGAYGEASSSIGINPATGQSDNSMPGAGAACVFVRSAGSWTQHSYLKAGNTDATSPFSSFEPDYFGYSVAVSGDIVVAGGYGEDSSASGVGGDDSNNSSREAGAAYIFALPPVAQDSMTLVTDPALWRESTTVETITADSNPWFGVAPLPDSSTFTVVPAVGAVHVNSVPDATTFFSGNSVRFFRTTFDLPAFQALALDVRASFDNDLDIFINGRELALEGNFSAQNFAGPNHRLFVNTDGTILNGFQGGQPFALRVASRFPSSFFQVGANEIVLALRNNSGGDGGGIAFRADFYFGAQISIESPAHLSSISELPAIRGGGFGFVGSPSLYIIRKADGAFWTEQGWASGRTAILPAIYDSNDHTWVSTGSMPRIGGKHRNTAMADGEYNVIALGYDSLGKEKRADAVITVRHAPAFTMSGFSSAPATGATVRSGAAWRFNVALASSLPDLRLRVQSTLTPNQEASWTFLDDGASMSRIDSIWTLNTTAVLAGTRFFRVIASAPGAPDETSEHIGPITVEGFADYGSQLSATTYRPYRTGTAWTFAVVQPSLFPDQRLRIQSSADGEDEGSWIDLPGGGQMAHVGSRWKHVTSEIPLGTRFFRAIASAPGYADRASDILGPHFIEPAWLRVDESRDSGTYTLQSVSGVQDAVDIFLRAAARAQTFYTCDPELSLHFLSKAALTFQASPQGRAWLTIEKGQSVEAPAANFGLNTTLILRGQFDSPVTLIGNDVGTLIANDGGTFIAHDLATLQELLNSGALLIANDGGTLSLIGMDGASLIGNDVGTLIGDNGSGLVGDPLDGIRALNPRATGRRFGVQNISAAAAPGFTGVMTVNGDYSQNEGAGLAIAIAGTNASSPESQEFDQLVVSGRADLAGVIGFGFFNPANPTLLTGVFQPESGTTFDVVIASRIATHRLTVRGPIWGDGLHFNWSVVTRPDGRQALRLVAARLAPFLVIQPTETAWEVGYPTNFAGYALQKSATLSPPEWTLLSNSTNRVIVDRAEAAAFYRMLKQ